MFKTGEKTMENQFSKLTLTLSIMLLTAGITVCQKDNLFIKNGSKSRLNHPEKNIQFIEPGDGQSTTFMVTRDGETHTRDIDLTEEMDIIVEFKEEPFFIQKKKQGAFSKSTTFFQSRFSQFANDIMQVDQKAAGYTKSSLKPAVIKREFYKLFFGVNLTVPRTALHDIQHLSYVKKIHLNKKLKAVLHESVPLIRADLVRDTFGTEGDGIVVGIIDTGIDYNHPALGGGFGPGYKVIGGYDVINNDNDPMDDYGHGTHVAGIVAADGEEIRGVAPKALLMAFKVLAADGWGTDASVMAGIELAVDPNGDGDYTDKVDIANISISGYGHPDDALSTAVDNGVDLGVVFCISADNNGDFGYNTIGSPGTARRAITVGATDKMDNVASFSSRGPNNMIYSIKPEVVAPGVNIYSSVLNGEYEYHDGTSMAAPHVSGVCALLKAIHPEWTPDQFKSSLMTTAIDIDEDVMTQGAGRIDALGAAQVTTFANPAHLSYGLDDLHQTIWTTTDTVVITNHADIPQDFTISFDPFIAGVNITASPFSFSLNSGESQSIEFSLTVDNEIVPYPEDGSPAFDGTVFFNGTEDTLKIPWAFVKQTKVRITFDEPDADFIISNEENYIVGFLDAQWIDLYTAEFNITPGNYDLLANIWIGDYSGAKVIVQEQIPVEGIVDLSVHFSDAVHEIELAGVDTQGQVLSAKEATRQLIFLFPELSQAGFVSFTVFELPVVVSTISSRFKLIAIEMAFDGTGGYVLQHPVIESVNSSITLTNDPDDYKTVDVEIQYPRNSSEQQVMAFLNIINPYYIMSTMTNSYEVNSCIWNGTLYLTPEVNVSYNSNMNLASSTAQSREGTDTWDIFDIANWINTDPFRIVRDSIGTYGWFESTDYKPTDYLVPVGGKLIFSGIPVYPSTWFFNRGNSLAGYSPSFYGALEERRYSDLRHTNFTIYDNLNNIMESGNFLGDNSGSFNSKILPSGLYRMEIINSNYCFENIKGRAILNNWCDLKKQDSDPPTFTSLRICNSAGVPTCQLKHDEAAVLRFSAAAYVNISLWEREYQPIVSDSTRIYYKKYGTDHWIPLEFKELTEDISGIGFLYAADLSRLTSDDSAAFGIKLYIEDQSGNAAEWILDPAFKVGNFEFPSIITENDDQLQLPEKFALHQNYPNPFNPSTTISFALPKSELVKIKIYDILGREIRTLVNTTMQAGVKRVEWDGRNQHGESVPSGMYFYKLEAGNYSDTKKMLIIR
jgi:subtilisin family serine protease